MHPNFSAAAIAACLLLSACASTPEASQNAADNNARYDAQKVQAIEKAARASGIDVRWVNYPQKMQEEGK
ncbi:hypothetical protein [Undibacterium terreum]|uniref:Lipoprotein n=1 Tax=Undibacterium terreum TaxID=1224302 RepID=A0A916XQY2_9BURK|nr:hypothetical protein [Undibacterium terreum]GGC93760.1 hypothetical protein GCM10011396_46350 [Undibacterium terreum]